MKIKSSVMRLYAVTDRKEDEQTFMLKCEAALKGGATIFELREKGTDFDLFLSLAIKLKKLCSKYSVPFIVNDNIEIARLSGADGVHLGQDDASVSDAVKILGKDKIIGVSAHNVAEALAAESQGASYLGCGAAFITDTKTDAKPIDFAVLKDICSAVKIPVIAIGGITEENSHKLCGLGLDGIAVVSAVFSADDPETAAKALLIKAQQIAQSSNKD